MKPHSLTISLNFAVGAPWEIVRYINPLTGRVTDLYTKLGDSGSYSGYIILIPDYEAVFSILSANISAVARAAVTNLVTDMITEMIVPTLDAQAGAEADRNFTATYRSTDPALNSSLTVIFDPRPSSQGLAISTWTSNGADMLAEWSDDQKLKLSLSIPDQRNGKMAFRSSFLPQSTSYLTSDGSLGPFSDQYQNNADWLNVDATPYGGQGLDLFVFDLDYEGRAVAITPAATRTLMERAV